MAGSGKIMAPSTAFCRQKKYLLLASVWAGTARGFNGGWAPGHVGQERCVTPWKFGVGDILSVGGGDGDSGGRADVSPTGSYGCKGFGGTHGLSLSLIHI